MGGGREGGQSRTCDVISLRASAGPGPGYGSAMICTCRSGIRHCLSRALPRPAALVCYTPSHYNPIQRLIYTLRRFVCLLCRYPETQLSVNGTQLGYAADPTRRAGSSRSRNNSKYCPSRTAFRPRRSLPTATDRDFRCSSKPGEIHLTMTRRISRAVTRC